jgi:hypothetical protein
MKQTLLALLTFIVLLTPIAVTAQQSGDFTYTTNNGAVAITGYSGPGGAVTIPSAIIDLPVTSIGSYAFYGDSSLTNITIPNGVTNIADHAFYYCIRLPSVTIPDSVVSIGVEAFGVCWSLTGVTIPSGVSSIGAYAFDDCSALTAITVDAQNLYYSSTNGILFDKSQTTLVECPCGMAGSYAIPNTVNQIGAWAFAGCSRLTDVTIPNSVTSMGVWAFADCWSMSAINVDAGNVSYSSANGVLFNQDQTTLIQFPPATTGSYSIPGSVTSIGNYAFDGSSVTNVTIPETVTSIGDGAFDACTKLTNVTIPKSVTSMGNSPFEACFGLTGITVEAGNPVFSSVNGVLFGQGLTTLIQYPYSLGGSYTIPEGVTSIGESAFQWCSAVTNVTVPASVSSIGTYAFYGCSMLASVYFEGDAPVADSSVFTGDGELSAVYYLPGTAGWGATFCGIATTPSMLAYPVILNKGSGFGVQSNGFGFIICWATNSSVVVEAATTLGNPVWTQVATNLVSGGLCYFSDPQWTNYPGRVYRVRVP